MSQLHNSSANTLLQQQQQQQTVPPASAVDSLTCQWLDCGDRATSAESLYEHVCERHVGRKSTNNLNLQCQWGNCRTTTVKRDHITSHIRVHVPLKPHKCDFCQKSFKRPQDLKKHVKTHADESVLLKTPEPSGNHRSMVSMQNGYQPSSKTPNYYADSSLDQNGGYNYAQVNSYAQHQASAQPSYGPVYYQVPQTAQVADSGIYESRKRGHDALNDFFGDVKRRHIDPNQYHDLSARFGSYQHTIQPMLAGYQGYGNGLSDDYGDVSTGYQNAAHSQGGYSMPFPELRSKNDLMSIDSFLRDLQNTVYEHPNHAAAAGVLPMGQILHAGVNLRPSNSPPRMSHSSQGSTPSLYHHGSLSAASGMDDTPALTPASYQSAHSPSSVHSSQNYDSPGARTTGSLYPTLPSVSALTDIQSAMAGVPHSSLGNAYDDIESRRRYSGGYLQRAQPATPPSARDGEDKLTELAKQATAEAPDVDVSPPTPRAEPRSPITASGNTPGHESDASDEHQEAWVQNMRLIEALREFVRIRLERGEFEDAEPAEKQQQEEGQQVEAPEQEQSKDVEMQDRDDGDDRDRDSLYPILRAVQEAS